MCPRTTAYHLGRFALRLLLFRDDALSLHDVCADAPVSSRLRPEFCLVPREDCARVDFRPFRVIVLNEWSVPLTLGSPLLAAAELLLAYLLDLLLLACLASIASKCVPSASARCAVVLT